MIDHGLSLNWDNSLAPCCVYLPGKKDTERYSYKQLDQYRANIVNQIQTDFKKGIKHSGCDICWKREESGERSLRQFANEEYSHASGLVDLEFRLGSLCNLKCIMCGPHASTQWYSELKKNIVEFKQKGHYHVKEKIDSDGRQRPDDSYYTNPWWEEEELVDFISDNISHLQKINISGGEPFKVKQFNKLFGILNQKKEKITIQINTNGTHLDLDNVYNILSTHHSIRVVISLEGIGSHNEYLRYPSKWQEIEKNIDYFIKMKQAIKNKDITLSVHHTFQPASIYSFLPLLEYCRDNDLPLETTSVYHHAIDLTAITLEEKQQFLDKLENADINLNRATQNIAKTIVEDIIPDQRARKKYLDYIKFLDKIRNTNYSKIFI